MKKIVLILSLFIFGFAQSQIFEPVKWSTSVEKLSDTEYLLISKANIESGWHLYSQNVPENGPIATSFVYEGADKNFKIIGNTEEEEGHTIQDPVFQMEIKFFH